MNKSGFPLSLNFHVCMRNEKEAIYGRSHINIEVEPCSTFFFMHGLSYTASILLFFYTYLLFFYTHKIYLNLHLKIT